MATDDSKPYGVIYCVTNTVNGKRYIGQTTRTIEQRWAGHIHSKGRSGCRLLSAAILKYGKTAFLVAVIATAESQEELDALEIKLIGSHLANNRSDGYNLAPGGFGGKQAAETVARRIAKTKGQKRTDEFRLRVAEHRKGSKHSEATRARMSLAALNRNPPSVETRAKLTTAAKKGVWTDERRAKAAAVASGKKHSEATKKKLSVIFSGRKLSVETIAKIVAANTGRARSEETCKKISEVRKAYWTAKREAAQNQ